ncbi:MAG: amaB 1 [Xanthobacteraceae bacterium]|jgi:acetylornithine deacetylase/succinyl-diaminopimelate desuccinylase-like protein|nr:amaB 1 [Xanthobacteraceae bacterium]
MVGPVGRLEVLDGATNLIPGRCELWLDIPSGDDTTRAAVADVMAAIDRIAWHLVSGAGHDAMMFNGRTDVGMLFVRSGNAGSVIAA